MKYFVPDLRLAQELPPQTQATDKLGGLPWGLPVAKWPKCRDCEKSQSLLAQFVHDSARLNLGREGRVLCVFQCNHEPGMCSTWEGGSGANACFVLEPEELLPQLTPLPDDQPEVEREVLIVQWVARDDGLTDDQAFTATTGRGDLPESILEKITGETRLGGAPYWIQSPDEAPGGWDFVGQMDSVYNFLHAPVVEVEGVWQDKNPSSGRSHYCSGANFGSGGIAYLFLRRNTGRPEGWFFWQCG